jgi:hypothetical protein
MSLGSASDFNIRMKEKYMKGNDSMPDKHRKAPWLSMKCGHGDIVIMHGAHLQKVFEVRFDRFYIPERR